MLILNLFVIIGLLLFRAPSDMITEVPAGCTRAVSIRLWDSSVTCTAGAPAYSSTSRSSQSTEASGAHNSRRSLQTTPRIDHVAAAIGGATRAACDVASALGAPLLCSITINPTTGGPQPAVTPTISTEHAAYRAIAFLDLEVPKPHLGPIRDNFVAVGYPVWLWTTGGTTGSQSTTTTVSGITVSLRHGPPTLTWNMGDGTDPFTCPVETPAHYDGAPPESTVCDHRFERMGTYHPTITATWTIHWQAGPDSGTITETLTRTMPEVPVGEIQSIVTG